VSGAVPDLAAVVRRVPDFPKPGILFYDISTVLADPVAWRAAVDRMDRIVDAFHPDLVAGIESRGFLFASALAYRSGRGLVMIRKVGKLPGAVVSHSYDLEYGSDTLQVSEGLVRPGARTVLVDDLIATGGTARAAVALLGKVGAEVVGAAFFIELPGLGGMQRLGVPARSLLELEG
jgi:adenine phosphoribosyltransferase